MQKNLCLALAAFVLLAVFVGCGKHAAETSTPPPGETINAVQFYQDFASAAPELKTFADKTMMSLQDSDFSDALKYLGQLDANPALNDAQKKSVADLTGQIKRKLAAVAAARS